MALVWRAYRFSCQPGVVFGKHRPRPWLSALPDTICCLSVIISFRYCAHGSGPPLTPLCCRCPLSAALPDTREPILDSRNKSSLVCLIPTEDKNNTNSNKKHLVSAYYYSFNCVGPSIPGHDKRHAISYSWRDLVTHVDKIPTCPLLLYQVQEWCLPASHNEGGRQKPRCC